jgi:hypothetical protein
MNKTRIIERKTFYGLKYFIQIQKRFLFWKYWKTVIVPGFTYLEEYTTLEEAKFNLKFFTTGEDPKRVVYTDE